MEKASLVEKIQRHPVKLQILRTTTNARRGTDNWEERRIREPASECGSVHQ